MLHLSQSLAEVETYIAAGANVNLQDGEGKTPLHYAISYPNTVQRKDNNLIIVKLLLSGANIYILTKVTDSPLSLI
jgi:ankyrin repeat protein